MQRAACALAGWACLVSLAVSTHAGDRRTLLRLDQALGQSEVGSSTPAPKLLAIVGELEREDARQRRMFAAATSKPLPESARIRLVAVRRAYEEGQGRALELARELVSPQASAIRASRLAVLQGLLRNIESASRPEPRSAFMNVRAAGASTRARHAAESQELTPAASATMIGSIPQILKDAAAKLAGPVEVYDFVRQQVRPELYHGFMKGPVQTFLEQSGNDADSASLLVMLLRAKGIEARYVLGSALIPAAAMQAHVGASSVELAMRALERAGIPHEARLGPGGVTSVRWERTWVEAYIPYVNYRGAMLDEQGKAWVPLDANFKPMSPPGGIDPVEDLGFDVDSSFEAYLAGSDRRLPLEVIREQITALLQAQRPGMAYANVLNRRTHQAKSLGLVPSTLPFGVEGRPEAGYEPPASLNHTVRIVGETVAGAPLFSASLSLPDILGKRFTLSYVPSSADDAAVVAQYGGLHQTPPFLIDVRPVLKVGGVPVSAVPASVGMAVKYRLRIEIDGPDAHETVTNTVVAGNLLAIGLGGRRITSEEVAEGQAAEILSARAWSYLSRWNQADEELADLFHVIPVRPLASLCLVFSEIQTDFAGGDPLYPLNFEWKGIAIDADLRSTTPVGVVSVEREAEFLRLSGLVGSVLENRIFEDDLQIESVSTAKGLQMASAQGIPIVVVNSTNLESVLPGLALDLAVKTEIEAAVGRGLSVRVPAQEITSLAWTGAPYLVMDASTGETGWQLQGGHSGGVTAPAVPDIPAEIREPLAQQREEEAPTGAVVANIERFLSRDFQIGTVAKALPIPLKVLATDAEGFAVVGAPITFRILGGGGTLVDPVTDELSETRVTVLTNDRGEAEAPLILGTLTSAIPRFIQAEGDVHPTQVGLNVVTADAPGAVLETPFSLYGQPDDRFDGEQVHFDIGWRRAFNTSHDGRLELGGYLSVNVTDQYENPISNVGILTRYRPIPEQLPPPSGWHHRRPATTTPATALSLTDFERCIVEVSYPSPGDCEGEAEEVVDYSSPLGAGAVVFLGDSPYSAYKFDVGTQLSPGLLNIEITTGGSFCTSSVCPAGAQPEEPGVEQGHRPGPRNGSGSVIEAYPPGESANLTFWASALYEEAIAELVDNAGGLPRYRAVGRGRWYRGPLLNSQFALEPTTPGTSGTSVAYEGDAYHGAMRMALSPQLNILQYTGQHHPDRIRYLPGEQFPDGQPVLDWRYVDPETLEITRAPDDSPVERVGLFELWGVTAELTGPTPAPVVITPSGHVAEQSRVTPLIQPAEYMELLSPWNVEFNINRIDRPADGSPPVSVPVLRANGTQDYIIPARLSLPEAEYQAVVRVPGVSKTAQIQDIRSLPLDVAACPLVAFETPIVKLSLLRDPLNDVSCGSEEEVVFTLCRDALVTLRVDGQIVTGGVNDGGPVAVADLFLPRGRHRVSLSGDLLGLTLGRTAPMLVSAVGTTSSLAGEAEGTLVSVPANLSSLPVGHTFVKGVDVFDGHLVQQATDLSARGRHLGLEVTRTYSSSGRDVEGLLGASWSFNYESRVFATTCGVAVKTADGASQVFTPLADGTFRPQKGYHAKLRQNADLSYDFTDKAGVIHHFREPEDPAQPTGGRRLDWIREPHGDELKLRYDANSRLESVSEWHPEKPGEPVRTLQVTYVPENEESTGFKRIRRVEILPHGISATYDYDARGNLESAITSTGLNWTYGYPALPAIDPYQLLSVIDPNGARTEFQYFATNDPFPGEFREREGILVVLAKEEFVKRVREFPRRGSLDQTADTEFLYDYSDALSGTYLATVNDARSHETRYTSGSDGAVTLIEEPENRRTVIQWMAGDILKASERDPNERLTEYAYDANGNRTRERIHAPGIGIVDTEFEFDPVFNKMTLSRDAEGRETHYEIDPGNGDLLSVTDALQNETMHAYDAHGQLLSTRDPRGFLTRFSDHNDYGDPRRIEDPLGNLTTRVYDQRGRLETESDTFGRSRTLMYDDQDRPLSQVRRSGGPAGNLDEVTSKTYFPLGQVQTETNPIGGTTVFTLDGMNRVVNAATPSGPVLTEWDEDGPKRSEMDRRGVRKTFEYDDAHRLRRVRVTSGLAGEGPTGEIAYFEYDRVGNKTLEWDHGLRVTRYEHDGLYRVERKVLPLAPFFERYDYDRVGNRLAFLDANNHETRMAYDALNRLTSVRRDPDGLNLSVVTEYNDPGALGSHVNKSAEIDVTRGLRTEFLYDELNREIERRAILQGEDGDSATNAVTYSTTTDYDDARHAMTVRDPRGGEVEVLMDGLDRVISRNAKGVCAAGQPACEVGTPANLVTTILYDGLGDKLRETDPAGRVKSWDYDDQGRMESATDFAGTTVYGYDGEGLKVLERDRRTVERIFTYDNLGRSRTERLVSTPFSGVPWSRETRYLDTVNNWRRVEKDAKGFETTVHLDGLGRELRVVGPDTFFTEIGWDGVNKRSEEDRNGNTTLMEYDAADRLLQVTVPGPLVSRTIYDDANNRKTDIDRRNVATVTQADALGRVVTVARAGVRLERNAYDENSNKILGEDAEGKKTAFGYDRANRVIARTDGAESADAATMRFVIDGSGNKTAEIDPRSTDVEPSMRFAYDGANRQTDVFNGEGERTQTTFDGEGNRLSVTPPAQPPTLYAWDELGKLLSVTQPATEDHEAAVTSFGYDRNRNKTRQTNALGFATLYSHDSINRLETMTEPAVAPAGPLVTRFGYDAQGNVTSVTDPKGQVEINTYDTLNRKERTNYTPAPGAPSSTWRDVVRTEYSYDENDNPLEAREFVRSGTDPPGTSSMTRTIVRTFDDFDRVETETTTLPDGGTKAVTYQYFLNGTRRALIDAKGMRTEYTYDEKNRVHTTTTEAGTPQAKTTTHAYFADDLLRQTLDPTGVVADRTYDQADRLKTLTTTAGAPLVSSYEYGYDGNGNRTSQIETLPPPITTLGAPAQPAAAETTGYSYDDANRLKQVTYPADSTYPFGRVVTYHYDKVGNREREVETLPAVIPAQPALQGAPILERMGAFDANNRLTNLTTTVAPPTVPPGYVAPPDVTPAEAESHVNSTLVISYDLNGNELSRTRTLTDAPGTTTTTLSTWNVKDHLVEQTRDGSIITRHEYDAEGRRTKKIGEEGIRQYLYDDNSLLAEYNSDGLEVAKYDYGADRLIRLTRSDEGTRYMTFDGLGSVTGLTDAAGAVTATYHLDAWGNYRFTTELDTSHNRFGFTGHYWDKESSLYYAKARYYDPFTARFTQSDSFLGNIDDPPSLHRYQYANANPTLYTDPTGFAAKITKALTIDGQGIAFGTDEVNVYANPTLEQLRSEVDTGNMSRAEAVFRQSETTLRPVAGTPDWQKSSSRLWVEGGTEQLAGELSYPMLQVMNGMLNDDVQEIAEGGAGVVFMALAPKAIGKALGAAGGLLARLCAPCTKPLTMPRVGPWRAPIAEPTDPHSPDWPRFYSENPSAARFGPGAMRQGELGPSTPNLVTTNGRTNITYELKNAKGEVVYVGRASGVGTPEQVMRGRLARGHDVFDANPGLRAEVKAVQGESAANKGGEGVLYEQRLREGAKLLNDPKSPPLSSKPSKADKVRAKVDAYHEDLKKPG